MRPDFPGGGLDPDSTAENGSHPLVFCELTIPDAVLNVAKAAANRITLSY